jgi:hypothetical protein
MTTKTERPNQKPDVRLQAMSSRTLTIFHKDGEPSVVWREKDGRVGGTIDRPGKVRWDPTDSRPRPGARLYPAGTHFELIYGGSPEECAVWGAWLPQPGAQG